MRSSARTVSPTLDIRSNFRSVIAMSNSVGLYDNVYADFASDAEAAVRRATYGEDIG